MKKIITTIFIFTTILILPIVTEAAPECSGNQVPSLQINDPACYTSTTTTTTSTETVTETHDCTWIKTADECGKINSNCKWSGSVSAHPIGSCSESCSTTGYYLHPKSNAGYYENSCTGVTICGNDGIPDPGTYTTATTAPITTSSTSNSCYYTAVNSWSDCSASGVQSATSVIQHEVTGTSCQDKNEATTRSCETGGACGTRQGTYPVSTTSYPSGSLWCEPGSMANDSRKGDYFPKPGDTTTWTCTGANGGSTVNCSARRESEVDGSCTGILPSGVSRCPGDTTGLTSNTSWVKVDNCTNTRKCEYETSLNTGDSGCGSVDGKSLRCEGIPPSQRCADGSYGDNVKWTYSGYHTGCSWTCGSESCSASIYCETAHCGDEVGTCEKGDSSNETVCNINDYHDIIKKHVFKRAEYCKNELVSSCDVSWGTPEQMPQQYSQEWYYLIRENIFGPSLSIYANGSPYNYDYYKRSDKDYCTKKSVECTLRGVQSTAKHDYYWCLSYQKFNPRSRSCIYNTIRLQKEFNAMESAINEEYLQNGGDQRCLDEYSNAVHATSSLENDEVCETGLVDAWTCTFGGSHKPCYALKTDDENTAEKSVCGNGTQETGEECDDGDTEGGDGCSSTCKIENICGPDCAKTHPSDTEGWPLDKPFCTNDAIPTPTNPVFPQEGGTVTWKCTLEEIVKDCRAGHLMSGSNSIIIDDNDGTTGRIIETRP